MHSAQYIDLRAAQEMCAVDLRTLRRWACEDHLAFRRSGRGIEVRRGDLRRALSRRNLPVPEGLESRPRILVADDDADLLTMAAWTLQQAWPEASVRKAHDGDQARAKLLEFRPELLVTDLRMPGLDGMVLAALVRESRELAHTKVLALTGFDDPETRWEVFQSGAHEYLRKPFEPRDLRDSAARLLGAGPF